MSTQKQKTQWLDYLKVMLPDVELSIRENQMDGLTEKTIIAEWRGRAVERQIRPEEVASLGDQQYAEVMRVRIANALIG